MERGNKQRVGNDLEDREIEDSQRRLATPVHHTTDAVRGGK
jgi:hypothetical protein